MEYIKLETDHVAGLLGLSGDPSPVTGYGVYVGMKAAAKARWGSDSLAGKTVAVQGAGKVAYYLCRHLHGEGVQLIVTDIDAEKVQAGGGRSSAPRPVAPDAIYDQQADIYAPCALGATINDDTLPRLKVEIIAGGANNQLAEDRHGDELEKPRHPLRAGLRDQRRRRHQRLRRAAPLAGRAGAQEGGGDLRDPAAYLRDRPDETDSHLPGGRPAGRAADRGGGGAGSDVDGDSSRRLARHPLPRLSIPCTLGTQMPEVIPIGADHAGFELKERLVEELRALGYEPLDLGTHGPESTDYPDYAHQVASRVEHHEARRGVLLCGTGLGMSYAANRHPGVRAAVAWSPEVARLAREHNDANVLILPARFVSEDEGVEILKTWLDTEFAGGRHARRVAKIEQEHG